MNVALLVCYDGTDFSGWQIQKNGRTVQYELESALSRAFSLSVRVTGSGRTDAGVHAAGQVCNFPFDENIKIAPEKIADALNACLPQDVRVLKSARRIRCLPLGKEKNLPLLRVPLETGTSADGTVRGAFR